MYYQLLIDGGLCSRMARYCFYCNRELNPGERCYCRVAQAKRAEQSSGTDNATGGQSGTEAHSQNPPPTGNEQTSRRNTGFKMFRERRQAKQEKQAESRRQRVDIKQENARGREQSKSRIDWKTVFTSLGRNFLKAITKPTSFIQEASYPGLITAVATQAIEAYMIAFILLRILTLSNLGNLIAFDRQGANMPLTLPEQWLVFGKLYLIAILFLLVRIVINNLVLRFIGRTRLSFRESGLLLTPGSIYYCIFLVFGLLLSSGSGIQTLLILVAGYGVRVMIDHIATRMKTGQTEDSMLRVTLVIFLITALVLGSIIGIITPNLSEFRVDISGQFT